jgi:hypothetical protein
MNLNKQVAFAITLIKDDEHGIVDSIISFSLIQIIL